MRRLLNRNMKIKVIENFTNVTLVTLLIPVVAIWQDIGDSGTVKF